MEQENGVSFVSALRDKLQNYGKNDDSCLIKIYVPQTALEKTDSGQLVVPSQLSLNFCNVTSAGPVHDIADVLGDVVELDLARNRISQWREVFAIISCMPMATFVNLSNNPLNESERISSNLSPVCSSSIHKLVLNSTKVSWDTISQLLLIMPQLQELHLSLNEFSVVTLPAGQTFPSITTIFFNGNCVSSWSEICHFGQAFPNLTSLVMTGNPITDLMVENSSDVDTSSLPATVVNFPVLKSLNLGETLLASWESVEVLALFPCLTDVRLKGILFFETVEEKLRRQLMIGYLPNVDRLNGSRVSADERETANRAFIRHYMNSEVKPKRYFDLVSKVGQLDPLADVSLAPSKSVLVTVHFEEETVTQRFRLNATVADVKQYIAEHVVHLPRSAFQLFYNDVGAPYGHEIMKFMQRTLLGYRVKDGDEIYAKLK